MPKGVYVRRPRPPKKYPAELVDCVMALYRDGKTQEEIAEEVGVSQKVVWRLMKAHRIPARRSGPRPGKSQGPWKGDEAGYDAMHMRVIALRGRPQKCEECGTKAPGVRYHWASLSGDYADPNDYRRLCCACHRRYDAENSKETIRHRPDVTEELVLALFHEGLKINAIARALGTSWLTVRHRLRKATLAASIPRDIVK